MIAPFRDIIISGSSIRKRTGASDRPLNRSDYQQEDEDQAQYRYREAEYTANPISYDRPKTDDDQHN
jgi:hypothetical protein